MTRDTETITDSLSWSVDIPLLTNRFLVWDVVRVLAASVALMYVLVFCGGIVIEQEVIILPPVVPLVTFGVLMGLFVLTGIVLGNRMGARFTVDAKGVTYEAEKRERAINRIAVVAGLLAGKPSVAGAGMLAAGRERERVLWSRIERAVVHEQERVIELRSGSRTLQRLHCPPELFDDIVAAVELHLAAPGKGR